MQPKQGKPSISPARRAAFDILLRVEGEGSYASNLLSALSESDFSSEDRALAQEITLGVLRWQKTLDYFVELYSNRKVKRLDIAVLIALRIGLYQLRHLERVPHSAAVNESVNLVKRARVASAAGLVNAVLRNAARRIEDHPGEAAADSSEKAPIEVSHPRWMLERWSKWLGEQEARGLALANNTPPATALRVNTLRTSEQATLAYLQANAVVLRPSEITPSGFVVESGPVAPIMRAAAEGLIYIQDEASQLISHLLDPRRGEAILDLCAAPGSKSSHIAALTADGAWIVACDIHPHRLATLRATCHRLGVESVDAVAFDATRELAVRGLEFDRVLIDAPCSGTGTLKRNPEIKWRLAPDDIIRLAGVQLDLLTGAAEAVRAGGRLVYSTCSLEAEENEDVVKQFIESGMPFQLIEPAARAALITTNGFVRTLPHRHGTDGFFAAVLEKRKV